MKKAVIIILAILPIFLVITISFAGRILALYEHISVEKVRFVDDSGKDLKDDFLLVLNVGEQKETNIRVFPDLATNKNVTYTSDREDFCTVDENGVLTGIAAGSATIIVKTEDGSKIDMLDVKVTQGKVTGVSLPVEQLDLVVGEQRSLTAIVEPNSAENKSVVYLSSDESVAIVDPNGTIKAVGEGQAIITVTTEDGGFTASCVINCVRGKLPIEFNFSGDENFTISQDNVVVSKKSEINLLNYLQFDEELIKIEDIQFRISSGTSRGELDGDKLTITGRGLITIVAYVGSSDDAIYQTKITIALQ